MISESKKSNTEILACCLTRETQGQKVNIGIRFIEALVFSSFIKLSPAREIGDPSREVPM